jgi:hypothetical protein
MYTGSVA